METTLKDQFITLWDTYFPQAGLPITFEYSADTPESSGSGRLRKDIGVSLPN